MSFSGWTLEEGKKKKKKKEETEQHRHKTKALSLEIFKILPDVSLPPPHITTEIDVPFIKAQQAWKIKTPTSQNKSLLKKRLWLH